MKLSDIQTEWESDCKVDRTELGEESLRIPQLHSKYFKIFSQERMRLKEMKREYNTLFRVKYEYYTGTLSEEDLKDNNWEPWPLRVLKNDLPIYFNADVDLVQCQKNTDLQEEKVDFIESIIKSLSTRGYQIKAAIDWVKFTNGV